MSDQAELNCLVVSNLADLEAAGHQIDDVIMPVLEAEVGAIFTDFIKQHGWVGEFESLDSFWFAPREWADADGGEGDSVCHFEIDAVPRAAADKDYFWLSTLTGAGQAAVGLYWASEATRPAPLGKLVAAHPDIVTALQAKGFVYDIGAKQALYLPFKIEREQLLAGLRESNVDEAAEAFAVVLEAAAAAAPLFQPLVEALRAP